MGAMGVGAAARKAVRVISYMYISLDITLTGKYVLGPPSKVFCFVFLRNY